MNESLRGLLGALGGVALALALAACGGGGGGSATAAPVASPPPAPTLDGLGEGVLLRLAVPEEGRAWDVAWSFAAGPGGDDLFAVAASGSHLSRMAPAEATAPGEMGIAGWREAIEIEATVVDETGDTIDPFSMARMAAGVDIRDAIKAIEGIPLTLSLTPRGAIRDIGGLVGMMEAAAAALGHDLPDEMREVPDFRAEIAEGLAAIAAAGLEGHFPIIEGILPEEPVTADSVIAWTLADSVAAIAAAEGHAPDLRDVPEASWRLTPLGVRSGTVVFSLAVEGGFTDGGEGFLLHGEGELAIEMATGLPSSMEVSIEISLSGPEGGVFPIALRLTANPA